MNFGLVVFFFIVSIMLCLTTVSYTHLLDYSNSKTIVWGSGFREEYSKFNGGEILSVRGKLSANKLKSCLLYTSRCV